MCSFTGWLFFYGHAVIIPRHVDDLTPPETNGKRMQEKDRSSSWEWRQFQHRGNPNAWFPIEPTNIRHLLIYFVFFAKIFNASS